MDNRRENTQTRSDRMVLFPFDHANAKPVNVFLNVTDLDRCQIRFGISWAGFVFFLPPQPSWPYTNPPLTAEVYFHSSMSFPLCRSNTQAHTHTSEHHHLPVWHASCAEGSTADKKTPTHTTTKKLISGLQSRTVHRGLSPQSCYAWAGELSHWSAFPHSPARAFSLVCYALASPLWKTSPMGEVGEI